MEITIIGTGNMARGIGSRAIAGGHSVTLLGTELAKAEALAGELGGAAKAGTMGDAIVGDVVVLAVWYPVSREVVERYGDQLDGRVVVDITNPLDTDAFEPIVLEAGSGAQEVAAAAPAARVVKAFNTTFAGTLAGGGEVAGQPLDVFLASDDEAAKRTVAQLAEDGGLRSVDAGPLRRARELEALGYLHMCVQEPLGTGYASAVKIVA
jgi:predicted dinucleotide-binding enzyme